jgi:glucose-1-phosphate adenylyltransferase
VTRPKILVLILAGGEGKRLDVLTQVRAKPSMPWAGIYRLIDFPLSNCVHSQLSDVWVIEQFEPHGLNDHLANGRPWDLDRTYGGLRILPPHHSSGDAEKDGSVQGFAKGNADAIHRHRRAIRDFGPDVILVLSADHVYKLDYRDVIAAHLDRGAEVTLVTTRVPLEKAGRFGNVEIDEIAGDGRVTGFFYKPDPPRSETVTTEVFVYDANTLLDTLEEIAARGGKDGESPLKDFGHELIPELVERGRAWAFELDGYWRDAGTISSYWESQMDLLAPEPPLQLDEESWPILTYGVQRVAARIRRGAEIADSLIAPGCQVHGTVEHSVLSPGVVVEEGATVIDSVVLHDTVIRRGARVERAIVDDHVEVGEGARIGGPAESSPEDSDLKETLTLIGQRRRIGAGAHIGVGERLKPATED